MCPYTRRKLGGSPPGSLSASFWYGQLLEVRGVLARLGAQLEQHLAVAGGAGRARPAGAAGTCGRRGMSGTEGWAAKTTVSRPVLGGRVGRAAEEGQRGLGDGRGVGAHALVHRAETLRVVAGVGEDDVRAVPQQQPVGELLVDDADVAGDDDGPAAAGRRAARPCSMAWTAPPTRASTTTSYRSSASIVREELVARHLAQRVGARRRPRRAGGRWEWPGRAAESRQLDGVRRVAGAIRRAVSAPHFHRVSESASTATRTASLVLDGTSRTLGRHSD